MNRLTPAVLSLALVACGNHVDPPVAQSKPAVTNPAPASSGWSHPEIDAQIDKKEYTAAIAALEALRATSGPDVEVCRRLVGLYRTQNDAARAILRAREALAAHPDAKVFYLPLAELYQQSGQLQDARATLEAGRKFGVDDQQLSLLLGSVLGRLGEFDAARAEFERAGRAGLETKVVNYNLALLLTQQRQSLQARTMFEEIVAQDPNWGPGRRELARVLLELERENPAAIDRALDLIVGAKDSLKDDWRAHETMGDAWLLKGDYEAALFEYTEALRLGQNPKSVEDRYRVAATKLKEQKAAAAKSAGGEAQAVAPNSVSAGPTSTPGPK